MATTASSDEILHDFSPLFIQNKDGRIHRLLGNDVVSASVDPNTGVQSKDVEISQNVSARVYIPKNANQAGNKIPLLIYFHGGGFVIESAFSPTYHTQLNLLVAEANVVAVSVNYRLAPENPLPICYEDSWHAIKWAAQGSDTWLEDHADFDRVYLGGDSAGGNIAHNMAIKSSFEKIEGLNIIGLFLNCPYFGGTEPIGVEIGNTNNTGVDLSPNRLWLYVYPTCSGLDDPVFNPGNDPKFSSLRCKKVLIYVAEKDLLKDRGWYYKEALCKSGWDGDIEVVEVEGEDHVFNLMFPHSDKALAMLKKVAYFLNNNAKP